MSDKPEPGTPEWHRAHPIFGTDFSKTPPEIIEEIRTGLARLRGQVSDIMFGYGWKESLRTAEEGLTLVISYLHGVKQEMEQAAHRKAQRDLAATKERP